MNKTFFTSDSHFNHGNIVKYCKRLEFCNKSEKDIILNGTDIDKRDLRISSETIDRMNNCLINNWNSIVNDGDVVYHLGDFSLGNVDNSKSILRRLKGEIHFIQGNHDKVAGQLSSNFKSYNTGFIEVNVNGQKIVLCHYAMKVWNGSHNGVWHLYGHSHGTLTDDPNSLSFDCGVDCHEFRLLSFDDVRRIMNKKTFKPIDHHGKE